MVKNVVRIKSGIITSDSVNVKIQKDIVCAKKKKNNNNDNNNIWNPATCSCKNGKYARNIIHDSVITCDKIIEETKTIPTKSISAKCTST